MPATDDKASPSARSAARPPGRLTHAQDLLNERADLYRQSLAEALPPREAWRTTATGLDPTQRDCLRKRVHRMGLPGPGTSRPREETTALAVAAYAQTINRYLSENSSYENIPAAVLARAEEAVLAQFPSYTRKLLRQALRRDGMPVATGRPGDPGVQPIALDTPAYLVREMTPQAWDAAYPHLVAIREVAAVKAVEDALGRETGRAAGRALIRRWEAANRRLERRAQRIEKGPQRSRSQDHQITDAQAFTGRNRL